MDVVKKPRSPISGLWIDCTKPTVSVSVTNNEYLLSPRSYRSIEDQLNDDFVNRSRRNYASFTDNEYMLSPRRYKVGGSRSGDGGTPTSRPDSVRSNSSRNVKMGSDGSMTPGSTRQYSMRSFDSRTTVTSEGNQQECISGGSGGGFLRDEQEGFPRESRISRRSESCSGRWSRRSRSSRGSKGRPTSGRSSAQSSGRRSSSRSGYHSGTTDTEGSWGRDSDSSLGNNMPTKDETIYLKTFYKVMTAFNDKQKTTLAFKDCGNHGEPMYRRVVFRIIEKLNTVSKKCTSTQRDLVIDSLSLICNDPSEATEASLKESIDDVLFFCRSAFKELLLTSDKSAKDKENLKILIHLLGVMAVKSDFFRKKLEKHSMMRKFIDDLLSKDYISRYSRDKVVTSIVKTCLKSQVLYELLCDMKSMLTSVTSCLELSKSNVIDSAIMTRYLSRVSDPSAVLRDCRAAIFSRTRLQCFTTEHKIQLQSSKLIPQLINRCLLDDLSSCTHILKIFLAFVEQPILREMLVRDYSTELVTLFMATLRCEESNVPEFLMKFWLTQRICSIPHFRNLIFRVEGAILMIMATMRSVTLDAGESLSVLSPFCDDSFFFDMSLTSSQLIQHFGMFFQCGETALVRKNAGEVLEIFTEGLEQSNFSCGVSNSFIDSGILFILQNMIGDDSCEMEWREKATSLLCVLVEDDSIRQVFLVESLGILHCLITSVDCFSSRSEVVMSVIAVLEVVAVDPNSHSRLFESDIVLDLAKHIKDTLVATSISSKTKEQYILHSLNIFDIISSSSESSAMLKKMNLDEFFDKFLKHQDEVDVRVAVERVTSKLSDAGSSPTIWNNIFSIVSKAL